MKLFSSFTRKRNSFNCGGVGTFFSVFNWNKLTSSCITTLKACFSFLTHFILLFIKSGLKTANFNWAWVHLVLCAVKKNFFKFSWHKFFGNRFLFCANNLSIHINKHQVPFNIIYRKVNTRISDHSMKDVIVGSFGIKDSWILINNNSSALWGGVSKLCTE